MNIFRRTILIFHILILPYFVVGQEENTEQLKLTASKLMQKGATLSYEGKHAESLDSFQLSLDYRKKIYGESNYYLAQPYMFVGIAYKNLGQNEKALNNYKLAETNIFLREEPSKNLLSSLYINIGNVHRAKLDYTNALKYFNQALSIYKSETPLDNEKITSAYYAIAEIEFRNNNYQEVLNIAKLCYSDADSAYQIYFDDVIGASYLSLGKYEEANKYYQHAVTFSKLYYGISIELVYAYHSYANFFSRTNHFQNATDQLSKAYSILELLNIRSGKELFSHYRSEGNIYLDRTINTQEINNFKTEKRKNLLKAIESYKKGLAALELNETNPEISEINIQQSISMMDCIELVKVIGDAYHEIALLDNENKGLDYSKNLDYALSCYNNTSNLIQKARKELSNDDSKIQLTNLQYQTISKIIETAYLAYKQSKNQEYLDIAFNNSEQLKSSAVFDKISNDLAQENSLIPDSLLELEQKLNNTISNYSELQYQEQSYDDPDSVLLKEYNDKIFNASRQRDELNRYMEENYPDYYNLKYSSSFLSMKDIQSQTDKKEALIEYVLIEPEKKEISLDNNDSDTIGSLYTFFVSNDKVLFNKTDLRNNEIQSLEDAFKFMSSPQYMFTHNEDARQFCLSAYKLYGLLIEPYENYLIDKHLTIIPDGKLNYLSFDGLLRSLPDTSEFIQFNKLDYLIKTMNINYANSVNIYLKNKSSNPKLRNHTLAFAPEYNSEEFEMTGSRYSLAPLPGVEKEVDAISKSVSTTVFKSDNATEQNFRAKSGSFDILHLAMHAYINDSLPAYSRLAFSQNVDSTTLENDGWLNTADIYNLKLDARMTVLSACNTGIGKLQKGEGLMSLARGFLYAGCPSVVMSLWEVEDEAGTQIMTSFYKYLKGGKTKDEALRLAKLKYLENSNSRLAHPHYWMSFKSIGDNSPIYTSYDLYFFAILILLIIAFSIDQGIRIKKARRNRQA